MKHAKFPLRPVTTVSLLPACLLALALACPSVQAQGDEVYLCVNAQGQREYKNTGNVKGCKKVELMGLTTVPAPKAPPAAPRTAASNGSNGSNPGAATPSEFPKVDSATQKARDSDRKKILQDELKAEESKLASLRSEYHNGEPERRGDERNAAKYFERVQKMGQDIASAEKNIEALRRELANLK
jgi:hypothetical protein